MTLLLTSPRSERALCRLRKIELLAEEVDSVNEAAAKLGISRHALCAFLTRHLGFGGWPPDLKKLAAIVDPARVELERRLMEKSEPCRPHSHRGRNPCMPHDNAAGDPRLGHDVVRERQQANLTAREEHERYWLDREREAHGETRQTRALPLSRMPI